VSLHLLKNVIRMTNIAEKVNRRGDGPVIYITSQQLFYDSIVTADPLSFHGPFQQLFPPETNPDYPEVQSLFTESGPGGHEYVGGRWWVDVDGNGMMDEFVDHFFSLCRLLQHTQIARSKKL